MDESEVQFVKVPTNPLRMTKDVKILFFAINPYGFIAGGFARTLAYSPMVSQSEAGDVDIFCRNDETDAAYSDYEQICLVLDALGAHLDSENPVSRRYSFDPEMFDLPQINLVKPRRSPYMISYGMPEEVVGRFDFTVCRAALLDLDHVLVDKDFEEDCDNHVLRIREMSCPVTEVYRVHKYLSKGDEWSIRPREVVKILDTWIERGEDYRKQIREAVEINPETFTMEEINKAEALLWLD
jgi:hypothetical protein